MTAERLIHHRIATLWPMRNGPDRDVRDRLRHLIWAAQRHRHRWYW